MFNEWSYKFQAFQIYTLLYIVTFFGNGFIAVEGFGTPKLVVVLLIYLNLLVVVP